MRRSDRDLAQRQTFTVRPGTVADGPLVVALFDDAIDWLVDRDLAGQWGSQPFSAAPQRVAAATRWAESGGLLVAECADGPVGATVLGDAPSYAPPAAGPEVYVVALVAARRPEARGVGRFLLAEAERVAAERRVPVLRLDCYAGNGGALVAYYRAAGFTPTETFLVGAWAGQVLQRTIRPAVL